MQVGIGLKFIKKTRKEHDCLGCGKKIKKGVSAINASGLDEDKEFWNRYTHIVKSCYMVLTEMIDMVEENDIFELIKEAMEKRHD